MPKVAKEPIISSKNTKKEILEAYEEALKQLKTINPSSTATRQMNTNDMIVKQATSNTKTDGYSRTLT